MEHPSDDVLSGLVWLVHTLEDLRSRGLVKLDKVQEMLNYADSVLRIRPEFQLALLRYIDIVRKDSEEYVKLNDEGEEFLKKINEIRS